MNELVVDSNTKLYKRSRSDNYYVAVKSYTQKNKYYRQSTKETELKNAKVKAKEIALNIFRNETVGNVVVEKTFNFVAKQFVLHTQNRFEKFWSRPNHAIRSAAAALMCNITAEKMLNQ